MVLERWSLLNVVWRLITICSAISLAMCLGFGLLWAASYSHPQFVFYDWIEKTQGPDYLPSLASQNPRLFTSTIQQLQREIRRKR